MKAVVIGESSGATMEQIIAVYPRHKAIVDAFVEVMSSASAHSADRDRGNMAIFEAMRRPKLSSSKTRLFLKGS